jgi:flagellar basal body-associated protein FliL
MAERGRNRFDSKFKDELKREIKQELLAELRNSVVVDKIASDLEGSSFEEDSFEETPRPKKSKGSIKLLIVLVLIVLILDFAIVFFYYSPNLFKTSGFVIRTNNPDNSGAVGGNCDDGTIENTCSKTKPYYCSNGKLIEAGYTCGCPNGYVRQFQSCKISS